jgi:hypothetical protein
VQETLTLGDRFQSRVRRRVTHRKVTHVTSPYAFSNGSFVPFRRSGVEFRPRVTGHIIRGEQFWGRAVRASRILWIRGASYLWWVRLYF